MIAARIGLVTGALFLVAAAQAQTSNSQTSPTGGPLKTTTGSNMPAPGLSGRHPNTNTSTSDAAGKTNSQAAASPHALNKTVKSSAP